MPTRVDFAGERLPGGLKSQDLSRALKIFKTQFVPQCFAGFHLVIPRATMKPEQKFFRTTRDVIERIANRRKILFDGAVAVLCAIKTDALGRSLVIIGGSP